MNNNPSNNNSESLYSEDRKIDETLRNILYFLSFIVIITTISILISFTRWSDISNSVKTAASFLSIGGAYLTGGAITGFLFGIPRSGTFRYKPNGDNSKSWYDDNTNLEEISDWLTKIIVGLTLIQFNKILQLLDSSANTIAISISENVKIHDNKNPTSVFFYPWAYSFIIFFMACGFSIGYLWTRINFALILTVSRKRLNQISSIQQQKEQLQEDVKKEKAELSKLKDEVSAVASQENIRKTDTAKLIIDLNNNTSENSEKLKQGIESSKSKPILVPQDIQKGRWGGKDVNNGKKLYAEVSPAEKVSGYFNVSIRLRPVISSYKIESPVAIFVHDSFGFPDNVIIVDVDTTTGEARADLLAYEAFAVGALCLDGTELELDLNLVQGYPRDFYYK